MGFDCVQIYNFKMLIIKSFDVYNKFEIFCEIIVLISFNFIRSFLSDQVNFLWANQLILMILGSEVAKGMPEGGIKREGR